MNALGTGILLPAWKTLYAQAENKGKEAHEWSLLDGGNMLLAGIATLVGGTIAKNFGFDFLIIFMFGLQLVAALISLKLL